MEERNGKADRKNSKEKRQPENWFILDVFKFELILSFTDFQRKIRDQ